MPGKGRRYRSVLRLDPAGDGVARIGVDYRPTGIVAAAGSVYVASYGRDSVLRISRIDP